MNRKKTAAIYAALTVAVATAIAPTAAFADAASAAPGATSVADAAAAPEKQGEVLARVTSFPNGQHNSVAKEVRTVEELQQEVKAATGNPVSVNLKRDVDLPDNFEFSGPANGFAIFGEGHRLSVAGDAAGTLVMGNSNVSFKDITLDCGADTLVVKPVAPVNFLFVQQPDVKGRLGKIRVADANGKVVIEDLGGDNLTIDGIEGFEAADGTRNTAVRLDGFGADAAQPYKLTGLDKLAAVQLSNSHIQVEGDATTLGALAFLDGSDSSITVSGKGKVDGLLQIPVEGAATAAHKVFLEDGATLEVGSPSSAEGPAARLDVVLKGAVPSEGVIVSFADAQKAPTVNFVDAQGNPITAIKKDEHGNYGVPAPVVPPAPEPKPEPKPEPAPVPDPDEKVPAGQPTTGNTGVRPEAGQQAQQVKATHAATGALPQTGDASAFAAAGLTAAGALAAACGAALKRRSAR